MELVMWKVLSKLLCFFVVNGSDKHWHWYGKAINRSFCGLLTQKVYFIINTYRITCLCSRYWAVVFLHAENLFSFQPKPTLFCNGWKGWPRSVLAPMTIVCYNSLLWMCMLNLIDLGLKGKYFFNEGRKCFI